MAIRAKVRIRVSKIECDFCDEKASVEKRSVHVMEVHSNNSDGAYKVDSVFFHFKCLIDFLEKKPGL